MLIVYYIFQAIGEKWNDKKLSFPKKARHERKRKQSLLSTNNTQDTDLNLNRSIQCKSTKWPNKKIKIVQPNKNN